MALVLKDRVRQTSTTAGTGTITLSGSVTGYQNFSVIGSGNTTYYTITDAAGNWEVGLGTYTSPNQLSRDTVYESSNANALVNFSSASKDVFVTFPAEGFSSPPAIGQTTPNNINGTLIYGTQQVSSPVGIYLNYVQSPYFQTFSGGATPAIGKLGNISGFSPCGLELNDSDSGNYKLQIDPSNGNFGAKYYSDGNSHTFNGMVYSESLELNSGSGYVDIYPATGSGWTLTLPPTSGSNNQILKTDGSGNLDWTAVQVNTDIQIPAVVNTGTTTGIIQMVDGGDGYDYLKLYTWDGSAEYGIYTPAISGLSSLSVSGNILGQQIYSQGDGTYSGSILINDPSNALNVTLTVPTTLSANYVLTLPTTAGSANQVLKTDGSGNLSWVNLNAPSIYTTASSQSSTSTTLANITGLTATLTANTTYRVDCFVTFQSAATTTGMNFGFTSPAGTTCMLEVVVPITNTAAASQLRTIFPNNSSTNTGSVLGTGVSTINSNHTARFSGIIKVGGTGGTFAAQYATEVASSAITIPAGSTMVIQQIS